MQRSCEGRAKEEEEEEGENKTVAGRKMLSTQETPSQLVQDSGGMSKSLQVRVSVTATSVTAMAANVNGSLPC